MVVDMSEKIVEGEVWINGSRTTAKLSPYFCRHGIWLSNRAGGFGGPHTEINLSPEEFSTYLSSSKSNQVKVALDRAGLGKIDECSGYAAADVGAHSRLIETCIFSVSRVNHCTKFSVEGQTGYLVPNSVSGGSDINLISRGKYEFRIWFLIPDHEIELFFKDEGALQAINDYVSRQIPD
jgi:hypothetical protein